MECVDLRELSIDELREFVTGIGESAFRAKQLFLSLHKRRLTTFDDMTDLSAELRQKLTERATASTLMVETRYMSSDGTRRYLMKTADNLPVETVFIPEEHRDTICFSSQSGCPLQCDFCLTAKLGLLRSLKTGEIIEQIVIALNDAYGAGHKAPHRTNLVAMGAGEPFLAYDSLMKAVKLMSAPEGMNIVPNRLTISTAGVVPRIREFMTMPDRPRLAISLAASNDTLRDKLMPINKKWPLDELLTACREFQSTLKRGERLTFEYVMLRDVNDSDEQARELVDLLNRYQLNAKVNLIPHNTSDQLPYKPSSDDRVASFKRILESSGVHAYVRRPRGRDIYAACGQLAAMDTNGIIGLTRLQRAEARV